MPRSRDLAPTGGPVLSSSAIVDGSAAVRRNLIVEGSIDAEVALHAHGVAIAATGRVRADIHAVVIQVEGEVVGDLFGEAEVRVCSLGSVRGSITAPSVIVEEGADLDGQIVVQELRPAGPSQALAPRVAGSDAGHPPAARPFPDLDEEETMLSEEQRSALRVGIRLAIEYSSNCPPIRAFVDDLSESGMFLDVDRGLPAGSTLEFSLSLPDAAAATPIQGRGVVVWSGPTGMGVEFTELGDDARQRIHFFVAAVHFGQPTDLPVS